MGCSGGVGRVRLGGRGRGLGARRIEEQLDPRLPAFVRRHVLSKARPSPRASHGPGHRSGSDLALHKQNDLFSIFPFRNSDPFFVFQGFFSKNQKDNFEMILRDFERFGEVVRFNFNIPTEIPFRYLLLFFNSSTSTSRDIISFSQFFEHDRSRSSSKSNSSWLGLILFLRSISFFFFLEVVS